MKLNIYLEQETKRKYVFANHIDEFGLIPKYSKSIILDHDNDYKQLEEEIRRLMVIPDHVDINYLDSCGDEFIFE